jgi:peptidoglycan/LPS O-acetylase OafA/YrhL
MIRNETLDGWRGFLALWVVIGHILLYSNINFKVLTAPGYAVDGFIFLSGYFIQASLIGISKKFTGLSSIKVFYLYRFMRTWPIYCLILVIYFFSSSLSSNGFSLSQIALNSEKLYVLFMNLFLVNGFSPQYVSSTPIPSWSLSLEFQFYIIYPLIFLFKLYKSYFFIFLTFIFALFTPIVFGHGAIEGSYAHFVFPSILPFRLFHFMLGVVWYNNNKTPNYKFLLFCILGMLVLNKFTAMLILVIYFSNLEVLNALNIFKSNMLQFVGRISYSLYLIHFPILLVSDTLSHILNLDINKLIFISIFTLGISITLSYLSFEIFEERFISLGKKLAKDI